MILAFVCRIDGGGGSAFLSFRVGGAVGIVRVGFRHEPSAMICSQVSYPARTKSKLRATLDLHTNNLWNFP